MAGLYGHEPISSGKKLPNNSTGTNYDRLTGKRFHWLMSGGVGTDTRLSLAG